MKFKYITKMIVILSFLFFSNNIIAIEIASYIKIKYENITLYDIIPQLVDKVKGEQIILGKIKIPGGKFFIKGDRIKAELFNIGIKNQKVPSSITVERDFIEIKTSLIETQLLDILKNGKTDFDYGLSISTRDTLRLPTGDINFKIEDGSVDKLGKKTMKALVYENNIQVYEFPFGVSIGKLIKEYTLIKDVEKGEKYNPSQVSIKTELVYEENKLKNVEVKENLIYTETLFAGTKILDKHLQSNTAIKKGDKVIIEINYGDLRLSDKGEALEKGDFGQEIEVKNLRTGKILKGIVISNNSIEIKISE